MSRAPSSENAMKLHRAVPTFVVSDVGATADWYAKELGFACAFFPDKPPYAYADLWRDQAEIMLLRIEGYKKPDISGLRPEGLWDAYIRMEGVRELYELVREKPFIRMPLTRQSYGDSEFEVRDPNGYILVLSELIE
jgi:catechol 2,3-dioxygenase-like lactoylglutathione lyase family enzyme